MDIIADLATLQLAFWKATKRKRSKADCGAFQEKLDENITTLRAELLSGSVGVGEYYKFTIYDPKERTICAASFRERVLHHALMNVCQPVPERTASFENDACRKGMGVQAAVQRPTHGGMAGS
jgi:RNA-directed DNA polymerase